MTVEEDMRLCRRCHAKGTDLWTDTASEMFDHLSREHNQDVEYLSRVEWMKDRDIVELMAREAGDEIWLNPIRKEELLA